MLKSKSKMFNRKTFAIIISAFLVSEVDTVSSIRSTTYVKRSPSAVSALSTTDEAPQQPPPKPSSSKHSSRDMPRRKTVGSKFRGKATINPTHNDNFDVAGYEYFQTQNKNRLEQIPEKNVRVKSSRK